MIYFSDFGTGVVSDPYWSSVKLLIGADGVDGSTTIPDESPAARGNLICDGTTAAIDTAQSKFGGSSLFKNAAGSYSYPDHADWHLTSSDQWTMEAWVRFSSVGADNDAIISHWTGASKEWILRRTSTGNLEFMYSTNGANEVSVSGTWNPAINTWYFVAADCDATNKLRVYVDGVMVASATSVPSFNDSSASFRIGEYHTGNDHLGGWIDEVRFTKGAARYASDGGFTVPTAAFPRG